MAHRVSRPLCIATGIIVGLASPVVAQQITAKTAWEDLRGDARDAGLLITAGGIVNNVTSLVASDVRIMAEDDRNAGQVSMDELRVVPDGEHVTLIPSEVITLVVRPTPTSERVFELRHDGEISYRLTEDELDLGLRFDRLDVRMLSAAQRGTTQPEGFGVDFTGLQSDLFVARAGTVEFSLGADAVAYDFAVDEQTGGTSMTNVGNAQIAGLSIAFEALEMDMIDNTDGALARAFDAGFMARLVMTTERSVGVSLQQFDGQEIRVRQVTETSEAMMELVDGAFAMTSTMGAGVLQGDMGSLQGELSVDGAAFDLSFPLVASPEDRPFELGLSLDGLAPTPETLTLLGAQEFAGESLSVALRMGADGRLLEELGEGFGNNDELPVDFSALRLDELALSFGDTRLTGAGAFVFLDGLMTSIDAEIPQGTGDFAFDLMGGDALIGRLAAAGLIPQDQQFFARMMMNGLGRPVGDDHLRAEVAIRPGGAVTVNGLPLPF